MSVHQIIYTSCKRGIRGVNDGQQIFSHDAAFPEGAMDQVKGMFTYIMPALEPGVVMTEELATTMPQAFIYRRLETGHCALALNTYLGRDYMGSAGRFGNQLSHVFLFDPADTDLYPCQYFGSDMLRSRMEFEEVNNPNQPEPLPAPILTPGYRVDVESVTEFLSEGGRMEIYQNMLWAMLAFASHRKRLVICDEPENIMMWIAALQFALPLKTALGINFTTYEFDPALSESRICGVVPRGTRFDEQSAQRHFTFDLIGGRCPDYPKDREFFDFIDTAMSFSYDSIQDFHEFLVDCGYDKADEGIYGAYALYSLLSDGLTETGEDTVERALRFAKAYGSESIRYRLLERLLENTEPLRQASPDTFRVVSDYIGERAALLGKEQRQTVRDLMVDRVLYSCVGSVFTEQTFTENFKQVEAVCAGCSISLSTELMERHNRSKLFSVMGSDVEPWKVRSVLYVLRSYVRERGFGPEALEFGGPMGEVYAGLIGTKAMSSMESAMAMAKDILEDYADQPEYMTYMMLGIDQAMTHFGVTGGYLEPLWDAFNKTICARGQQEVSMVWQILGNKAMTDRFLGLYVQALESAGSTEETSRVYAAVESKLRAIPGLAVLTEEITERYYACLSALPQRESYPHKVELFRRTTAHNGYKLLSDSTLYELEKELLTRIVLGRLDDDARRLSQWMFKYNVNVGMKLPKKLLPILLGMAFEASGTERELVSSIEGILRDSGKERLDLTVLSTQTAGDYLEWITPMYTELCQKYETMERLFGLHTMDAYHLEQFFQDALKNYMKDSKRDNRALVDFLGVCLERGNRNVIRELTKMVKKLNKNRQEELDEAMEKTWGKQDELMAIWKDILEDAQAPNPVLENLAGIFRRKNKDKDRDKD